MDGSERVAGPMAEDVASGLLGWKIISRLQRFLLGSRVEDPSVNSNRSSVEIPSEDLLLIVMGSDTALLRVSASLEFETGAGVKFVGSNSCSSSKKEPSMSLVKISSSISTNVWEDSVVAGGKKDRLVLLPKKRLLRRSGSGVGDSINAGL